MRKLVSAQCALMVFLCFAGCRESRPIVGTWFVKTPESPFPYHMFVFHSDGTVQQSNADAGDSKTSDSNAVAVWVPDGDSRGEISFSVRVKRDTLSGIATAIFHDIPVATQRKAKLATASAHRRSQCEKMTPA